MKALTKISIGFLALAAVALWFTSCSSEDVHRMVVAKVIRNLY